MTDGRTIVAGAILVGGKSRRMGGGDKCLKLLGGVSLLARIIDIFRPQVHTLLLNANGDPERFSEFGLPVKADHFGEQEGPLAGIMTAMKWASGIEAQWVFTVAGDAPFIPNNLVSRCLQSAFANKVEIVSVSSNKRVHPVCALWNVGLFNELESILKETDVRKIDIWTSTKNTSIEEFSADPVDPFFNVNSLQDLEKAKPLLDKLTKS